MPKAGTADDNVFPVEDKEQKAPSKPAESSKRDDRQARDPYPEPAELSEPGSEVVVESPDGAVAFAAVKMSREEFGSAGYPERKKLQLLYKVIEVYAGQPRPYYSYDEIEQLRRGEMKR